MRISPRWVIATLFVLGSWISLGYADAGTGHAEWSSEGDNVVSLDGQSFEGEMTEKEKGFHWVGPPIMNNVMTFHAGKLYSNIVRVWGFDGAPYTTIQTPDGISFKAEISDPTKGTFSWSGWVRGHRLSANGVWSRSDRVVEYSTQGQLRSSEDYSWNIK